MNRPVEFLLTRAMQVRWLRPLAFRLLPNHYQYKPGSFRSVVRFGLRFELDISNLNDWEIFFSCTDRSLEKLISESKPGFCVFDVGANIGFASLRLAERVGPSGTVIAFEPFPFTFAKLQRNLSLNPKLPVKPHPVALGSAIGEAKLAVVKADNLGRNKIQPLPNGDGVHVNLTTVDEFCAKHHIAQVDLLKLDVEGYEMQVLLGARQLITRCKPGLLVEIGDENLRAQGSSPAELVEFLHKSGYTVTDAGSARVIELSENFKNCHFDAWCHP